MKKIITFFVTIIILISGASYVLANFMLPEKEVLFLDASSNTAYIDSEELQTILVKFESNTDISNALIHSSCSASSKFMKSIWELYYFSVSLLEKCDKKSFSLKLDPNITNKSLFYLTWEKETEIYSLLIDYSSSKIEKVKKTIESKLSKQLVDKHSQAVTFNLLKKQRIIKELEYKKNIITAILNSRSSKYSVPVQGYKIATELNVIPNAARHYRKGYTDWIHHGWDIMAPKGTAVTAIDNGIIIRIVRGFSFEDISNIKKGAWIDEVDKLRNLDILRGNQVWLKTSKGDVIFYSHLEDVSDDISEWQLVSVWDYMGTIWITGVPDKDYKNYHLHFAIHKNPYTKKGNSPYLFEDYMKWDWYLKGLSADDVVREQKNIFNGEAFN